MYLYILLAVLASTFLFVVFTLFKNWNIDTFQGIVFNYLTACLLSFFFNFSQTISNFHLIGSLIPLAGLIGFMFITIFLVMALTTQRAGLAVASVAAKMSLMIPVIFGILFFKESFTIDKMLGIVLALMAIFMTNYKDNGEKQHLSWAILVLPLILFVGSGLIDAMIKIAQAFIIPAGARELFIMLLFGSAFTLGSTKLCFDLIRGSRVFKLKNLLGGIMLGVPNFFSIYFILKALEVPKAESSIVFSVANLSTVILASIAGYLLFSQKLNKVNGLGIAVAVVAIILLSNIIGLGHIEF